MYKLRFHLAQGKNFMNWQVKSPDGTVKYYNPELIEIRCFNAVLINKETTAKKIFNGAHKEVCAWVEAENIITMDIDDPVSECNDFIQVRYNPRVTPNWMKGDKNVDGSNQTVLISQGRNLYTLK